MRVLLPVFAAPTPTHDWHRQVEHNDRWSLAAHLLQRSGPAGRHRGLEAVEREWRGHHVADVRFVIHGEEMAGMNAASLSRLARSRT